jgi:tetratricopeptide (TPR) repeat protein
LRPKAEYHAAADVASWIKLADRFIKEARRDDLRAALVSRSSKASTEETRKPLADADRIIQLGDDLFRAGRYEEALKYYESAGATARESAAAYFRRGQAYVATGRYDEAVDAFKRGVDADPSFLNSGFRLQDIYAQEDALTQHVEALAAAALRKTDDADLLFLIGAFLHFEGKAERAEKFLRRAAELAAEEAPHIHEFIAAGKRSAPLRLTSDFTSWSETANAF